MGRGGIKIYGNPNCRRGLPRERVEKAHEFATQCQVRPRRASAVAYCIVRMEKLSPWHAVRYFEGEPNGKIQN